MENIIELYTESGELKFNRRLARDVAFKYIFEWQYGCEEKFEQIENLVKMQFKDCDKEYIQNAFQGVKNNLDAIDEILEKNAKGWKKDRLSKVCLACIRLALCEMLYMDDIPAGVTINEIVEIVKTYDSPQAGAYANGILGSVQKALEEKK
ncbi:MAG: transcription antitermination factor NusB [Clostridia bacterium]|nr:transcription antitermination factor NusB [Clostridia bacterium]